MNVINAIDRFLSKAKKQQNKLFKKSLRSSHTKKLLKAGKRSKQSETHSD